jgi:L-alanine-DL-glutamate epimerase-like enolase superfamily enzyme
MRIKAVIERTVKVGSNVRNARVDLSQMTVTALAVITDHKVAGRPLVGFAFNSFGRYGCGGPLRERFIPRLLALESTSLLDPVGNLDPGRVIAALLMREKSGGHAERSMGLGTLELALWDIVAKREAKPLFEVLAARDGNPLPAAGTIPTYAAGGFYGAADDLGSLRDEVARWRDGGFIDAKIKGGGGDLAFDRRRIETALGALAPQARLAIDLSCAFDGRGAADFAAAAKPYGLWWLEEPCDPLDYAGFELASAAGTPIAAGENLFSAREVDNFLRYTKLKSDIVLQPDPPLAYGVGGMREIIAVTRAHGLGPTCIFPHGGNMMSLHVAAGLGLAGVEAYPGQFGIFGGFSNEVEIGNGQASLPAAPGLGFEEQPALYGLFTELVKSA